MNQFFDTKRFGLLVSKHWADNKRHYTLALLAYTGLLLTWYLFGLFIIRDEGDTGLPEEIQHTTFYVSLFAAGTFYASQYFSDLAAKDRGIHLLLVPASSFEKLLCSLLFTVILFPILSIACFYLVNVPMVALANSLTGTSGVQSRSTVANIYDVNLLEFNATQVIKLLFFFVSIASLFLLGSVYFKKYNYIKTIISGFLVCISCFVLVFLTHDLFDDYNVESNPGLPVFIQVLAYAIAPLSWMATYFVLKTKKV